MIRLIVGYACTSRRRNVESLRGSTPVGVPKLQPFFDDTVFPNA